MTTSKINRRLRIKHRVRNKISGTAETPRMSVFRSNKQIYVQIINDETGTTLASASSLGFEKMLIGEKTPTHPSAAVSGSFSPALRFEKSEIHKVFLDFSNLNLN